MVFRWHLPPYGLGLPRRADHVGGTFHLIIMEDSTLLKALASMDGSVGFDAVIICTSNPAQERYWQSRLEKTRGQAARQGAVILAVHEDWGADGAGNGLGTLYAYTKASAKAKSDFSIDLDAKLKEGWSLAIYHTAGKGTRLAPLPGSENNNKPGVKLPSILNVDGVSTELTILEAVIRQTNSYAPQRKGRCSVFWGDQVFIPSSGTPPSGSHPADILACLGPMPTEAEWIERGLEKYGLIAVNSDGNAAQVEKVSFGVAQSLLATFGSIKQVGPSLGSFSVSAALLFSLLKEFAGEIKGKVAKLDSDPHFWMPLTLPEDAYSSVMQSKGMSDADARSYYSRMQTFKSAFLRENGGTAMLGCIDAGTACYWWDYGLLKLYQKNNLLAAQNSPEAAALRTFLRIVDRKGGSTTSATVDESSLVLSCRIGSGSVAGSVCTTVDCPTVEVTNCVLVNVVARRIKAANCILYNVVDDSEEGINLADGAVRADVFIPGRDRLTITSALDKDGGKVWKERLAGNEMSFEEVYNANTAVDVIEAQASAAAARARAAAAGR